MRHLWIIMVVIISTTRLGTESLKARFSVWNVGQGSWSTYQLGTHCLHFDMGGEMAPLSKIVQTCRHKKNQIFLTHLDRDHIRFLHFFYKRQPKSCIVYPFHPKLRNYKRCDEPHPSVDILWHGEKGHIGNPGSVIFLLDKQILITGDSPIKYHRYWLSKIQKPIRLYLAGHHGSHTSTSTALVKGASLQQAVASARKKRFGHPHKTVIKKLRDTGTPLLSTEDWGHVHFSISSSYFSDSD